jgi:hypothetical protein
MVTHRWWGNKFCKRTCKGAYLRELALGRDKIRRRYGSFSRGWGAAPCRETKTRWRARFRPRRLLGYSGREAAACKNDCLLSD